MEVFDLRRETSKVLVQPKLQKRSNFTNNYIPEFVLDNLNWYQRDGPMTYIDKLKYDNFVIDTDAHFKKMQIVSFDIIHRKARDE